MAFSKMGKRGFLTITIIVFILLAFLKLFLVDNIFYTGWDNLHPEFDLFGYIKKVIFRAWVEHQGL